MSTPGSPGGLSRREPLRAARASEQRSHPRRALENREICMAKGPFHALLPLALGVLSSSSVAAQGLRCGDRLASPGSTTYEVRATCGDPDAANRRIELRTGRGRVPVPCYEVRGQGRHHGEVEQT